MKNPITLLADLATAITGARDGVKALRSADRGLRDEHARLTADRSRIVAARPPKAELHKNLAVEIQAVAVRWRERQGDAVVAALAGAVDMSGNGRFHAIRPPDLAAAFPDAAGLRDARRPRPRRREGEPRGDHRRREV